MLLLLLAGLAIALIPISSYPASLGSDWLWYRNGIDRLAIGQPLYDPTWLLGPFNYVAPANAFHFNQAPWLLPLVAPFTLLPEPTATSAWLIFMDAALLLGIALVVPRWPPIIVIVMLTPPVLMSLAWGNIEALVALGVAFWIMGRRRRSLRWETVGIALASLKVVTAIPMVLLAVRSRRWKAAAASAMIATGVCLLVSLASRQNVLVEFVTITANIEPVVNRLNLSPAAWLGGSSLAYLLVRLLVASTIFLATARVRNELAALAILELLCCFLATNPYADWLVVPELAFLASFPFGVQHLGIDHDDRNAAPGIEA